MNLKYLKIKLGTSSKISKDLCGDLNITGTKGWVYIGSDPFDVWFLYIHTGRWKQVKEKLNFMVVSQDGDQEGILKLDRYPTSEEAKLIRKYADLGKKRVLSSEQREKVILRLKKHMFSPAAQGHLIDRTEV